MPWLFPICVMNTAGYYFDIPHDDVIVHSVFSIRCNVYVHSYDIVMFCVKKTDFYDN
jgi:hypothetical protein